MIRFPIGLVSIQYPGYFWDTIDKQLLTIKGGTLRPLKKRKPSIWSKNRDCAGHYYEVSVNGKKKFISLDSLLKLRYTALTEVLPIQM